MVAPVVAPETVAAAQAPPAPDQSSPCGSTQCCQRASRHSPAPISVAATEPTVGGATGTAPPSPRSQPARRSRTSVLPPKIPGTRRSTMSRTNPPPTAVIVPSSTAGNQPSPNARVFSAPAAAQQPSASASINGQARSHTGPSILTRKAIAAPAKRSQNVGIVGEGNRRAVLQQRVADDPATKPGQYRQGREPDRVQTRGTRDHPAQHGVGQHTDEIQPAQRLRHRRASRHNASAFRRSADTR